MAAVGPRLQEVEVAAGQLGLCRADGTAHDGWVMFRGVGPHAPILYHGFVYGMSPVHLSLAGRPIGVVDSAGFLTTPPRLRQVGGSYGVLV